MNLNLCSLMSYQSDLLKAFNAQLISHSALLLASLTSTFIFLSKFRPHHLAGTIMYHLTGGALFGVTFYVVYRLILYGQLWMATIHCSDKGYENFHEYYLEVYKNAFEYMKHSRWAWPSPWIIASFRRFHSFQIITRAICCLLLGCLITWLIYYSLL